jgi:hypothetical protein
MQKIKKMVETNIKFKKKLVRYSNSSLLVFIPKNLFYILNLDLDEVYYFKIKKSSDFFEFATMIKIYSNGSYYFTIPKPYLKMISLQIGDMVEISFLGNFKQYRGYKKNEK